MRRERAVVTGAAGFIGSHLTDALLAKDWEILGIDNLSAGRREFLDDATDTGRFDLQVADLLDTDISEMIHGYDAIFHLAANPDVRSAAGDTLGHFEQNIRATYLMLEACVEADVNNFVFASTSTVYGEVDRIPTPEDYGPLVPISIYGAAKLAGEALVSSYCHTFGLRSVIYRFANVVGDRSTHNVLHDFIRKLRHDPSRLEILGADPGTDKSYVHVSDTVQAIILGLETANSEVEIFNIGTDDTTLVHDIADIVTQEMGLDGVGYEWTGGVRGGRGWVGDVRTMLLDTERIHSRGWRPRYDSSGAIRAAVRSILG